MTIYAIVNNILSQEQSSGQDKAIWSVISPSAILQGGNPYFVADFADRIESRASLALRIGKLGKSIASRFAYRYVDAIAPCSIMLAPALLKKLREEGMPWSQALSYDRSIAIGKFIEYPFADIPNAKFNILLKDGESTREFEWDASTMVRPSAEDTINQVSRDNTLKTGDILIVGISATGPEMSPGQRMSLNLGQKTLLGFNIR